jgi:hypothetical protein
MNRGVPAGDCAGDDLNSLAVSTAGQGPGIRAVVLTAWPNSARSQRPETGTLIARSAALVQDHDLDQCEAPRHVCGSPQYQIQGLFLNCFVRRLVARALVPIALLITSRFGIDREIEMRKYLPN